MRTGTTLGSIRVAGLTTILLMQNLPNFLQFRFDLMLVAAIVRMVVFPPYQLVRHVLLRSYGSWPIVRVPIPLMIAPTFIRAVGAFLKCNGTWPINPASTSASALLMAL